MAKQLKRKPLTYAQAVKLLPDGDDIHTFRNTMNMLIGADWRRESLLKTMKKYAKTLELSGEQATAMGHGLVLIDDAGALFIQTKKA